MTSGADQRKKDGLRDLDAFDSRRKSIHLVNHLISMQTLHFSTSERKRCGTFCTIRRAPSQNLQGTPKQKAAFQD